MTVVLQGRGAVRNSQSGRHLGQRSCATAPTGRTYDRKRSDQNTVQHPCEAGAVHISHVSGLCTQHFMTAGPDVLRWSWSLSGYRAWLTQDDATGCPDPAVHVRCGFTSSHYHRANWDALRADRLNWSSMPPARQLRCSRPRTPCSWPSPPRRSGPSCWPARRRPP